MWKSPVPDLAAVSSSMATPSGTAMPLSVAIAWRTSSTLLTSVELAPRGYLEAKAVGYDVKAMRAVIRLRKMPPDDRKEMEAIIDLYKSALGLG